MLWHANCASFHGHPAVGILVSCRYSSLPTPIIHHSNSMPASPTSPLGWPQPQGLWHPSHEKDSCGVGFIAHLKGKRSHDIILKTLTMNAQMDHRGASGSDPATGDGAAIF